MKGLEILEQVQNYVGWELHGQSGISLICDGEAVNADLRQPDFEITQTTTRLICSNIHHWLRQKARKGEMDGLQILGGDTNYAYWKLHGVEGSSVVRDRVAVDARFDTLDSELPGDQVKRVCAAINHWLQRTP